MTEEKTCIGCGAVLQTEDEKAPGYAPAATLEKEMPLCRRCFRLRNYNELEPVPLTDDDFLKILNTIGSKNALVVYIVDIFDFNGSWIPGMNRFAGSNPVLLVGNKADLLPKSVKENKLIHWMTSESRKLGLQPEDILLVSADKGTGIDSAIRRIEDLRAGRDVYVVGCTNVGKSTFINRIIKQVAGGDDVITTSHFPGTTLDMIDIPLDDGKSMYDTPGIINHHQMAHLLDAKDLKVITPKKEIKPKVFQLNEEQTLFLGGLARFDYLRGGRTAFTVHISNALDIHRTKLEKADDLYARQKGDLLTPPAEDAESFPELVRHEFSIREERTDIVISGLGWITVQQAGKVVAVHAPEGVAVMLRPSLI